MLNYLNKRSFNQEKGFSLIEVMIAVSIGSLLLLSVFSVEIFVRKMYVKDTALMEANAGARTAMDLMTNDIRSAIRIVSEARTINGVSRQTNNTNTLVLEVPAIDGQGAIDNVGVTDFIAYHLNASNASILERSIQADGQSNRDTGTRAIMTNFNSLLFESGGQGLTLNNLANVKRVDVTFQARKATMNGGTVPVTLKSSIKLRNNDGV